MFRRLRQSQLLRGRALAPSSATSTSTSAAGRRWEIDPSHTSDNYHDAHHSLGTSHEDHLDRLRILYAAAADSDSDSLRSGVDSLVSRAVRRQGKLLRSASTSTSTLDYPTEGSSGSASSIWQRYGFASPSNSHLDEDEGDPPPYSTFPSRPGESATIAELADTSTRDNFQAAELDAGDTARERAVYIYSSPPPSYPRQSSRSMSASLPSAPPSDSALESITTTTDIGLSEEAVSTGPLSETSIGDTCTSSIPSRSSNIIPPYMCWPNRPYLQTNFSHPAQRAFHPPPLHSSSTPGMQSDRQASSLNDTSFSLSENSSPSSIKSVSFAEPVSRAYPYPYPYPHTEGRASTVDNIDSDSDLLSPLSPLSSTSANTSNAANVNASKVSRSSESKKTDDSDVVLCRTRSTPFSISISVSATSLPSALITSTSVLSEVDRIARAYRRFKQTSKPTDDDKEEQLAEHDADNETNLDDKDDINVGNGDLESLGESLSSLADTLRSFSTHSGSSNFNRDSGGSNSDDRS